RRLAACRRALSSPPERARSAAARSSEQFVRPFLVQPEVRRDLEQLRSHPKPPGLSHHLAARPSVTGPQPAALLHSPLVAAPFARWHSTLPRASNHFPPEVVLSVLLVRRSVFALTL